MPYISSYLQHLTLKFTEQALKSAQTDDFLLVSIPVMHYLTYSLKYSPVGSHNLKHRAG